MKINTISGCWVDYFISWKMENSDRFDLKKQKREACILVE
jgi:hypothetical protein